ncbi:MAG: hypothetical protein U0457_00220 [Candidatus Sericytochromatia bacterium]
MSKALDLIKGSLTKLRANPESAGEVFFKTEPELDTFMEKFLKTHPDIKFFIKKETGRIHLIYINIKVTTKEEEKAIESVFEKSFSSNLKASKSFDPSKVRFNMFRD